MAPRHRVSYTSSSERPMLRRMLKKILNIITVCVLVILTLEVCARVEDWVKWDAPLLGIYSYETLAIDDQYGRHNRPNAEYEKWKIDSLGFRGPDIPREKPDGVLRVLTVGASETFGLYESPGHEYPMQLQSILDSLEPGRFQVLNAGCPGMTPPRIKSYFQNYLLQFEPDFVIFYPQPSVYLDLKPVPDTFTPRTSDRLPSMQLRILDKLRTVFKRFVPRKLQMVRWKRMAQKEVDKHPSDWQFDRVPNDRLRDMKMQITDLCIAIANHGVGVILSTNAAKMSIDNYDPDDPDLISAWRFSPRATKQVIVRITEPANRIIRSLDSMENISVVDIASRIHGRPRFFADMGHFSDIGARVVAEQFANEILRRIEQSGVTTDLQAQDLKRRRNGAG